MILTLRRYAVIGSCLVMAACNQAEGTGGAAGVLPGARSKWTIMESTDGLTGKKSVFVQYRDKVKGGEITVDIGCPETIKVITVDRLLSTTTEWVGLEIATISTARGMFGNSEPILIGFAQSEKFSNEYFGRWTSGYGDFRLKDYDYTKVFKLELELDDGEKVIVNGDSRVLSEFRSQYCAPAPQAPAAGPLDAVAPEAPIQAAPAQETDTGIDEPPTDSDESSQSDQDGALNHSRRG